MGGMKLLLAAVAAALAIGLAACGDGDDATSTTAPAESKSAQENGKPANDDSQGKSKKDGGEQKSGSSKDDSSKSDSDRVKDIGNFVPKQHEDSGGGSKQFRAPEGFDNSIQDFGEEATGSDFEEASTALHNFLDARAVGDWTAACEYLAADIVESLQTLASQSKESKGMSCGDLLGGFTNKAALPLLRKEAEKADVGSLRTEGDQSFIIYRGLEGSVLAMRMTEEEDGWKVASLGGTPLN